MEQQSAWGRVRLWGGLGLGLGALLWFLARLEWRELAGVLLAVDPAWLIGALVAMLVHYGLHAVRWGVFLRPLDRGIGLRLLWSSTAVLWGFNTVMPLRAGNLLRPLVIARVRGLPYPTVLFATVAEYVFDTVAILGLVLWLLWREPAGPLGGAADVVQGLAITSLVLVVFAALLTNAAARDGVARLIGLLPSRRARAVGLRVFRQMAAGMRSLGSPWRVAQAAALTVAVWGSWLGAAWCCLRAFGLDLPLVAALTLEAALSLAMMVPQAPGFLGVFQLVTEEVLTRFGAPAATAQAVALAFWTVTFGPITVFGLAEGARYGVRDAPTSG